MQSVPLAAKSRAKSVGAAFRALLRRTARRVEGGTRSPATLAMQRQHVEYLLERIGRTTPVAKLTPGRIARLLEQEAQGRRQGRRLSGSTLRKRASTLSQALELVRGRPPRLPEIPFVYVPRPHFLATFDDYERLRDSLAADERLWFVDAVWTGQRRSDVDRNVREDFDPDTQSIVVRSTKTGRAGLRIHAADELVRELLPHWERLPPGAKLVPAWPWVNEVLRKRCRELGLEHLSAHSLRHTFFTWYVQACGFTPELLLIGGWKDLQVPSRVYAHALPVQFRGQIERTVALARSLRRGPQKISSRGLSSKRNGGDGVKSTAAPATSLVGTYETGRDRRAGRLALPAPRSVSAEGIEPSTNGLRVPLLPKSERSPGGDLPMEGPPCPQQPRPEAT